MRTCTLRTVFAAAVAAGALALAATPAVAQEEEAAPEEQMAQKVDSGRALLMVGGFAAASFCVGISVLGAAWAVAKVGTAAMGAVAEKPELMGRSMVYVGLAEGLAIYGLIVAIIILGKLG